MVIELLLGLAIQPYLEEAARFRVEVFSEYPYLYEGTVEFELKEILPVYVRSKESAWVIAKEDDRIVGILTGIPLAETAPNIHSPFLQNNISMEPYYCLADLMVLKEYRGKGIGKSLYHAFEEFVRTKPSYRYITFYEISRPLNDPKRPANYHSLDPFWSKRDYAKHPELNFEIPWSEIGSTKDCIHAIVYWIKKLP